MKKILFFTYDFPYPTNTGGKNRAYNLLKFSSEGLNVSLFSFTRKDFDPAFISEINKLGIRDIKVFKRKKKTTKTVFSVLNPFTSVFKSLYFDKEVKEELIRKIKDEGIDVIHFESFYTGFYISDKIKNLGVKQIFGTENIEFKIYQDYARYVSSVVLKPAYYSEVRKIKVEESQMMRKADICLAVTNQEASLIKKITEKKCFVVENGVDTEDFKFKPFGKREKINIVFVGNFSYFPNLDAVKFFYNEVFLNLDRENIIFTIVGKNVEKLSFIKNSKVKMISFINDIKDIYKDADIFVSPIRIGGGTNFKVLEAMASGVPVVANFKRIQDLGVKDEIHALNAYDKDTFIKQITRLINDPEFSKALSNNARDFIEKNYSWFVIGNKMNKIWKEL